MASEKLVNLQEEVTCPICLELLTEPLSLDCGHSFCQICITTNSKESVTGQKGARKCPVCRINYESGKLRPNWHLANIVQRIREVKLSLQEQEKHLCAHHGEKLLLFCEEDGKVICWLCERSQEHRGHPTFLMEEVAQEYQVRDHNGEKTGQKIIVDENCLLYFGLYTVKSITLDFNYLITMNLGPVIFFLPMLTF